MPEAHIENGIRAQAVLGSVSGLARDVFVNTFHFLKAPSGRPTDADLATVADMVKHFYNTASTEPAPLDFHLSRAVSRATDACQVRVYRLDDPAPRPPAIFPFTLNPNAAGVDDPLPREIALCLSYKAVTKPGPRGRGRVYIGPLRAETVGWVGVGEYRPTNAVQLNILAAGKTLRDTSGTANLAWQVYSTLDTTQHMHTITNLWVDNEFDTVRQRGLRATARVTA
jgi:hypothetical protein